MMVVITNHVAGFLRGVTAVLLLCNAPSARTGDTFALDRHNVKRGEMILAKC